MRSCVPIEEENSHQMNLETNVKKMRFIIPGGATIATKQMELQGEQSHLLNTACSMFKLIA